MTSNDPRPLYDDQPRLDDDPATRVTTTAPEPPDTTADTTGETRAVHPLDEERPERVPVAPAPRSMKSAHLTSVVLSLLLTPVGLVALDFGYGRGWSRSIATLQDGRVSNDAIIAIGVAAGAFLLVGALSRLSGLGPLLAGLVFGVLPTVGFLLAPVDTAQRLLDIADLYDGFMRGIIGGGSTAFPVLAGLMVGSGLLGRWRRKR